MDGTHERVFTTKCNIVDFVSNDTSRSSRRRSSRLSASLAVESKLTHRRIKANSAFSYAELCKLYTVRTFGGIFNRAAAAAAAAARGGRGGRRGVPNIVYKAIDVSKR